MKIVVLGAAGFIGTNLIYELIKNKDDQIIAIDRNKEYFIEDIKYSYKNVKILESDLNIYTDFDNIFLETDIVYHLISTTVPGTSNQKIPQELMANVVLTSVILESCVRCKVKKIIFLSSGGAVYGIKKNYPINEESSVNPITAYGMQKISIEKLLYLYNYMHGLDYTIIRLANPYGPYQKPNGIQGAVTTFIYKVLNKEIIEIYGDGTVIRDYLYIDDVIQAILKIARNKTRYKIYNIGCGYGTSIKDILEIIRNTLHIDYNTKFFPKRPVDVPVNYLDISRYKEEFGELSFVKLSDGIKKTADFMKIYYKI